MKSLCRTRPASASFDMTPVIDVVFLLIIFFMLVFQFKTTEQFDVALPDKIGSAQPDPTALAQAITLTVMRKDGHICYAVGSEILPGQDKELLKRMMISAINGRPQATPAASDMVNLRCDKTVSYGDVRPVIEALAQSTAGTVIWTVLRD